MDGRRPETLPPVLLTSSGLPVLQPGEIECSTLDSVDIESEEIPGFPTLRSGVLILTTLRLIWITERRTSGSAIPLSAVVNAYQPKKSIKKMFRSPRLGIQLNVSDDWSINEKGKRLALIYVVMRGKMDHDAFLTRFWEILRSRAWESKSDGEGSGSLGRASASSGEGSVGIRASVVGVSGILRKEQELWESTDRSLQEAFQDLNALMGKAKDMVLLAEKMRVKLLAGPSATNASTDEEMGSNQDMQDWLLSVGIVSPVTKETAGALYHQQLSRQLADFIKGHLERSGGMIALIDAYCLFNRARGTELISPEDMLQACAIWEKYDVPVMLRKFDSGVKVIQSKTHSDDEVFSRIESLVVRPDALRLGISASDAARTLGIAPALAKEHLLAAETRGLLCRDASHEGLRFYVNLFKAVHSNDINLANSRMLEAWVSATSTIQ
ncbi:unnamed protein product [Victoria cruziana]